MKEPVIVGYLRTAQSRSRPNDPARDWFGQVRGDELAATVTKELVKRVGIDPKEIDNCLTGSAMGVNEQWTYGGRIPVFLANLPETIAARFVDQQCGSAMAAVQIGSMEIMLGYSDVVLCLGMEHMTRVPMDMVARGSDAIKPNPALIMEEEYHHWDMMTTMNMGLTAEKLAAKAGITRQEMDAWGKRSHELAAKGQQEGFFDGEILPVEAEQGDGSKKVIKTDQAVRADTTMEGLAGLKPAFKPDGIVTAGNSSPLNAAATAMIIMSKDTAKKKGLKPLATIRSMGWSGVDPTIMGEGPVPASKKALESAGLKVKDIDYWEINEAFCVVALNCIKELGIDPNRVNVMGGGTAIGHPLGATGIRLVGTLARILQKNNARYGLANACCGGGQGVATIIEREK
ncbi:MAG: acetyl-CoA C-acetyltransferase [Candidatus Abyssobacteria bacterium SURF_17]|uniref:Acetyl-CoA C-acetyltransferase n=1 Tax=Candidatus Abyssobacteria bacterium SURF_17 TaxID=2093361 RepID=A0A419EVZ4_9BACT|nr:MAG: acetyl-CoA C-acetyltransferase [Candidatus Abyssubacteria bacterium SURF_17]